MVRKIWRFIGDVKLTVWLLVIIAAVMAAGSMYCLADYQYYNRINEMPVQDWLLRHGLASPHLSWWLILLFVLFVLFGINCMACTVQRIASLMKVRSKHGPMNFFVLLIPSIVHVLFLTILLSHFITFTMSSHHRFPLREGGSIDLPDGTPVRIGAIKHDFFPEGSLLKGRVSQTSVALTWEEGGALKSGGVRFMEPLSVNGFMVSLDMQRDKRGAPSKKPKEPEFDKNTCNKEQAYHLSHYRGVRTPRLYAMITYDPGLAVLVPSFSIMIALMVIYYLKAGTADRSE